MYYHRDLLLHSIPNNLPQNTLLPFWKSVISSVLTLLVPCGIFGYFLLSESIWGTLILPLLVLDSA